MECMIWEMEEEDVKCEVEQVVIIVKKEVEKVVQKVFEEVKKVVENSLEVFRVKECEMEILEEWREQEWVKGGFFSVVELFSKDLKEFVISEKLVVVVFLVIKIGVDKFKGKFVVLNLVFFKIVQVEVFQLSVVLQFFCFVCFFLGVKLDIYFEGVCLFNFVFNVVVLKKGKVFKYDVVFLL